MHFIRPILEDVQKERNIYENETSEIFVYSPVGHE